MVDLYTGFYIRNPLVAPNPPRAATGVVPTAPSSCPSLRRASWVKIPNQAQERPRPARPAHRFPNRGVSELPSPDSCGRTPGATPPDTAPCAVPLPSGPAMAGKRRQRRRGGTARLGAHAAQGRRLREGEGVSKCSSGERPGAGEERRAGLRFGVESSGLSAVHRLRPGYRGGRQPSARLPPHPTPPPDTRGRRVEEMPPPLLDSRTQRMTVKEGRSHRLRAILSLSPCVGDRARGRCWPWGLSCLRPSWTCLLCGLQWPRPQCSPFPHFLFLRSPGSGPRIWSQECRGTSRAFCVSPPTPAL